MRTLSWLALSLFVLGCSVEETPSRMRLPVTCDGLVISVKGRECPFFYSDTRGGFLTATLSSPVSLKDLSWSVGGTGVLRGIELSSAGGAPLILDSAQVYPHEAVLHYGGGTVCRIAVLDGRRDGEHLLGLRVMAGSGSGVEILCRPDARLRRADGGKETGVMRWHSPSGALALFAGGKGSVAGDRCVIPSSASATVVLAFAREAPARSALDSLSLAFEQHVLARRQRMDALLGRAYFRTSDETLTRGVNWLKLSLDALVVSGRDTLIVPGLPWDGSLDGRANVQALGGLDFATGDYSRTASIARMMMRQQDTAGNRPTFGRIADRVIGGKPSYGSADIAPWLVREAYDHIVRTKDSVLLRLLDPVIRRSIEGTYRYHTDGNNFMTHGEGETWMGPGSPRGNRACEQQLLWYLEQVIGSSVANFLGQWKTGQLWTAMADSTARSFNRIFVDTTRGEVCDHLRPDGKKVFEVRPNALLCLEVIGYEAVQQKMLKQTVSTIAYPFGVGTLNPADRRFSPYAAQGSGRLCDGPVWTWLAGPLGYALTRYDREDLSYRMLTWLLLRALEEGGSLPAVFEAALRPGETVVRQSGRAGSAGAMAELVRSAYQDILGVGVDAVSRIVSIQPKLPDHITDADVTVMVGDVPVRVLYEIRPDVSRVVVESDRETQSLKINVVWRMKTGDAWRGSVKFSPGRRLTLVFGPDDAIAYAGEEQVELGGKWNIRGYSREKDLGEITFAPLQAR